MRLAALVFLIVLASVGIGLGGGGAPVLPINKRENTMELNIELVEQEEDQAKMPRLVIKE